MEVPRSRLLAILWLGAGVLASCSAPDTGEGRGDRHDGTPAGARTSEAEPFRAVLISDLNESYGTVGYSAEVRAVIDRIITDWRPNLVIAAGDLIAGQDPELSDARVRAMWAAFDSVVADPLRGAGIPLIAALGNHDASGYPAHARDRRLAVEHWRRAGPGPEAAIIDGSELPLRYTARHGDVYLAVWDGTNQESSRDPELLEWLSSALRTAEAREASHRLVVSHLPLYPVAVGRDRPGEFLVRGDSLRRELEELGATAFVSGHHHAYYPGRRGGLTLLHAGALGSGPRPLIGGGPARKSVAVLDFEGDSLGVAAYEVLDRGALRPIDTDSLPPVICVDGHRVVRRDLPDPTAPCGGERDD